MPNGDDHHAAATSTNQVWIGRLEQRWAELLQETLVRGFHGSAALEVTVQDGTIQSLRRVTERKER